MVVYVGLGNPNFLDLIYHQQKARKRFRFSRNVVVNKQLKHSFSVALTAMTKHIEATNYALNLIATWRENFKNHSPLKIYIQKSGNVGKSSKMAAAITNLLPI